MPGLRGAGGAVTLTAWPKTGHQRSGRPATRARCPHTRKAFPCWVDAHLSDVAAGKRFYGELFGWTFEEQADAAAGRVGVGAAGRRARRGPGPQDGRPDAHRVVRVLPHPGRGGTGRADPGGRRAGRHPAPTRSAAWAPPRSPPIPTERSSPSGSRPATPASGAGTSPAPSPGPSCTPGTPRPPTPSTATSSTTPSSARTPPPTSAAPRSPPSSPAQMPPHFLVHFLVGGRRGRARCGGPARRAGTGSAVRDVVRRGGRGLGRPGGVVRAAATLNGPAGP